MPPEIIAQGFVAEESYQKALDHGKVEIYRGCVKIIGQDRAGKTSLKRSLCGLPFIYNQESTIGVEVSHCSSQFKSWHIKEDDGVIVDDDVAFVIAKDIHNQTTSEKDSKATYNADDKWENPQKRVKVTTTEDSKHEPTNLVPSFSPEAVNDKVEKDPLGDNNFDEAMKFQQKQNKQVLEKVTESLIKFLKEKKIDETIKDKETTISIWDFAGQHLYYASHPVFMSHRAVYILVYNLEKDLDAKAEPRVRQGMREILLDNASNETNLDNFLSWLVTVHCLCHPYTDTRVETEDYICPPVIIVGTHAASDKLSGNEDERKNLIQIMQRKIEDAIQNCEFQKHVVKPFFIVDNMKSAGDDGIQSLHSKIKEILSMEPYYPELVPIRWFHFEKALQVLMKEKKKSFMLVKELSEIAEQVCSIDQTEITTMMTFYHRLGIIIKYGDIVVLNTQWLIDLFKRLITIPSYDQLKPKHEPFWRELEKTGRLHEDLINHVFKKQLNHASAETENQAKKDILHMMQHFGLIAKIIPSEQKTDYCYLVPSHLTSSPDEELKKCSPSTDEPCPLYIRFRDGFIPHGLYFQLICRWCSIYGSQEKPNLFQMEPKLFRNAAKFVLDNNSKIIMTVVCCKSTIKVCLHSGSKDKTNVDFKAVEIKKLIQESLDILKEKCPWYRGLQYDLCVRCPLCADNDADKTERQTFGDDDCLHPTKDNKEYYCEENTEWPEVPGLQYWYSTTVSTLDLQISSGDLCVSNGLFVVINIAKFDEKLQGELTDRIGSDHDEKAMIELFRDYFNFEVVNLSNKNKEKDIKGELRRISFDKKYEDKDCFVLCIMSHGVEDGFKTFDGKTVDYKEIVYYFKNDVCKTFRGKPKLFIIQACRGAVPDRGVAVTDSPDPTGEKRGNQSCAFRTKSSEKDLEHVIPCDCDTLVAFCCSEGYLSCRVPETGSYYIQSLVRIFHRYAATTDVLSMFTMVHKDVGSKQIKLTDEPRVKQAPMLQHSLAERVYLCSK